MLRQAVTFPRWGIAIALFSLLTAQHEFAADSTSVPQDGWTPKDVATALVQVRAIGSPPEQWKARVNWRLPIAVSPSDDSGLAATKEVLEQQKKRIRLDFADTPVTDVIAFLHDVSGINMTLDPAAVEGRGPTLTLKVEDMPLTNALDIILTRFAKLSYHVEDGCIRIGKHGVHRPAKGTWLCSEAGLDALQQLLTDVQAKIDVDFAEVFLDEAVGRLGARLPSPLSLNLDTRTVRRPYPRVTLRARQTPLLQVLQALTEQANLQIVALEKVLLLTNGSLDHVTETDQEAPVVPASSLGRIYLPGRESPEILKIAEKLDERISLDFADTPVTDVVAFLHDVSRINMMLDPSAIDDKTPLITLKVEDMTLRAALDVILRRFARLNYVVRSDGLFISDARTISWMDPTAGLSYSRDDLSAARDISRRLAETRLTVDFEDEPLPSVVWQLASQLDINMAIDSAAVSPDSVPRITFRAKKMRGSTVLGLVLYFGALRGAYMHRMLHITPSANWHKHAASAVRSGYGVVLSGDGRIATRAELISGAKEIRVITPDGAEHTAQVASVEKDTDVAILKTRIAAEFWLEPATHASGGEIRQVREKLDKTTAELRETKDLKERTRRSLQFRINELLGEMAKLKQDHSATIQKLRGELEALGKEHSKPSEQSGSEETPVEPKKPAQ